MYFCQMCLISILHSIIMHYVSVPCQERQIHLTCVIFGHKSITMRMLLSYDERPFKSVIQSGWKLLIHLSFSYIRSVKHLPKRICLGLKSDPHTLYQSDSSKLDRSVPDMIVCNAIMPYSNSHDIIFLKDDFSDYLLWRVNKIKE